MNENLITMDNTFSRKELEEAFWLGFKCIGLLDYDASNRFNDFTSDIMAKRQLEYNKRINIIKTFTIKKWWENLSKIEKEKLSQQYYMKCSDELEFKEIININEIELSLEEQKLFGNGKSI